MAPAKNRRVVVTGLGAVSPIGIGVENNWNALMEGRSGVETIPYFDTTGFTSKIGGIVKEFNAVDHIDKKALKQMDVFTHYALAAAKMAHKDSGLTIDDENADRVGVLVGAGIGGLQELETTHKKLLERGPGRVSPFFICRMISNLAPGQISIHLGAKGPNLCSVSACATGTHSIGDAAKMIERGLVDAMIAGGTEAGITPLSVAGFCAMKALSTRNDAPHQASRPFDRDRDGFVIAEGSGILILEELEHAKKRGAKIYCELSGYGLSSDAHHISTPAENGEGMSRCMNLALKDAALNPEEIAYINAHGTSTEYNDWYETMAIKTSFGEHAKKLKISSTKSMTGHLLGGAGGVEAVYTALTLDRGVLPPTTNYENPDPRCDLDYIPNKPQEMNVDHALSNSFGFGGTNATLVFSKLK